MLAYSLVFVFCAVLLILSGGVYGSLGLYIGIPEWICLTKTGEGNRCLE